MNTTQPTKTELEKAFSTDELTHEWRDCQLYLLTEDAQEVGRYDSWEHAMTCSNWKGLVELPAVTVTINTNDETLFSGQYDRNGVPIDSSEVSINLEKIQEYCLNSNLDLECESDFSRWNGGLNRPGMMKARNCFAYDEEAKDHLPQIALLIDRAISDCVNEVDREIVGAEISALECVSSVDYDDERISFQTTVDPEDLDEMGTFEDAIWSLCGSYPFPCDVEPGLWFVSL